MGMEAEKRRMETNFKRATMGKKPFPGLICGLLVGKLVFGAGSRGIVYTITILGSNQWQYTYEVTNLTLSIPINESSMWFDYGLYHNLAIATFGSPAGNWNEIVRQPEAIRGNGGYDALVASLGIGPAETVSGFCIRFNGIGTGDPCSRFCDIVNPSDFTTIDSRHHSPGTVYYTS